MMETTQLKSLQSVFYSWSAVCILTLSLHFTAVAVRSLQSAVRSPYFTLTGCRLFHLQLTLSS